ncbi:MAG: Uncharacterised protein [Synechococcus sp. CC9902]|nr:MAG: Uncharacterised protein [Synechococcus sp. CC9902]
MLLHIAKLLINLFRCGRQLGIEQAHSGPGFVDQIDGLVRQEAVGDVAVSESGGRHQRFVGDLEAVMLLVTLAKTPQNFDRVVDRGFAHIDGLEATLQSGIPFDVLAVFIEGCCSDALKFTPCQSRLQDVGGIDGSLCGTGTDQGVHLVDHQDHVSCGLDLLHDLFEPLLKFTPVLGTCNQQTDVESENTLVLEDVRNVSLLNPLSEAFSDGGFTNPGLTDQDGVVLGAASQNLDHTIDFVVSADNGIELGLGGHLGEVAAELVERGGFGGTLATAAAAAAGNLCGFTQHPDHLGAHFGEIHPEVFQHTSGNTFAFSDQTQQQVLGADVVMSELAGFLKRQFQYTFGPWSEWDFDGNETRPSADDLFNFNPGVLEVDAH